MRRSPPSPCSARRPLRFRARVERVATTRAHGLELQLRDGPAIWFGDRERLTAKWAAAAAVIADPQAAGASYVDVAAPERPAVGGLSDGAPATSETDDPDLPDGASVDPETGALLDLGAGEQTPPPARTRQRPIPPWRPNPDLTVNLEVEPSVGAQKTLHNC